MHIIQSQPHTVQHEVLNECLTLFRRKSFNQSTVYADQILENNWMSSNFAKVYNSHIYIAGQHYGYRLISA